MKSRPHTGVAGIAATVIAVTGVLTNLAWTHPASAMHAGPHHSFLGGPWELVVKMGLGGTVCASILPSAK